MKTFSFVVRCFLVAVGLLVLALAHKLAIEY